MGEAVDGSRWARHVPRSAGDTGVADKLSFVRAATLRLLDLMHDGDAVALVTFDDSVNVVKPLTLLDSRSRQQLAAAVRRLQPGGSTNLDGGFRAGLEQLAAEARRRYGCKLVLLSDGQANVGEARPAVLAEVAAGAAHNGVTTSTLGVGTDYNLALMTALAEAGNGDFSHIAAMEALDDILREEFTTAAEVTARAVEVTIEVPERLAFGTNINGYRQESSGGGFTVHLGDLVRPKEFLFELTSPVPLEGDELSITARAAYLDTDQAPRQSASDLRLPVREAAEVLRMAVDDEVMVKLLTQLPARAELDALLGYEAGDHARARAAISSSRQALASVHRLYGPAAELRPELTAWESRLTTLDQGTTTRSFGPADVKTMYAASHAQTRSRPWRPHEHQQ
jgi:Ca-activated chloride channel family protein